VSLAKILEEEARLVILRCLAEQPDQRTNSSALRDELDVVWGINRSRDWLHVQFGHLAEIGAIIVQDVATVKIATLTARGLDHVERRSVLPGVKRPSPPEV
jgi:hypothetical protein